MLYIYSILPDDGLQICSKHAKVDWQNKLRTKSASSWFYLHEYIGMHSQQNTHQKKNGLSSVCARRPNILPSVLTTSILTVYLHLIYVFSIKTSVFTFCLLTPRTSIIFHNIHLLPLTFIFSHFWQQFQYCLGQWFLHIRESWIVCQVTHKPSVSVTHFGSFSCQVYWIKFIAFSAPSAFPQFL
jgi:hypothetical protein